MTAPPDALAHLIRRSGLDATGLDGTPASGREYRVEVERTVALFATTLAALHDVELPDDPSDVPLHDPAHIVEEATAAVRTGRVRPDTLGSASSTRRIAFWKSMSPILNWTPLSRVTSVYPSWAS